jgi:hypothetical protein
MSKNSATPAILTLVCSRTGGEVSSGAIYTPADLERAKPAKLLLYCPYCRESHLFMFSDARLKPIPRTNGGSRGGSPTR